MHMMARFKFVDGFNMVPDDQNFGECNSNVRTVSPRQGCLPVIGVFMIESCIACSNYELWVVAGGRYRFKLDRDATASFSNRMIASDCNKRCRMEYRIMFVAS